VRCNKRATPSDTVSKAPQRTEFHDTTNTNTISRHYEHQHHFTTLRTKTPFHDTTNTNTISRHYEHQHHFTTLRTPTPFHDTTNANTISRHYEHQHHFTTLRTPTPTSSYEEHVRYEATVQLEQTEFSRTCCRQEQTVCRHLVPKFAGSHPAGGFGGLEVACWPLVPKFAGSHPAGGFGGLEVACWPLVPKFAGSHPAEAVGILGRKIP
jgi:hypothetical protein